LRQIPGRELLSFYNLHLQEIVSRHHGEDLMDVGINLREACDYYIKLHSKFYQRERYRNLFISVLM